MMDTDSIKKRQLQQHKTLATALFVLMAIVYIACVFWLKNHPSSWVPYVKAFAEAAMVGALADWFAVTALFSKPMGLPIPHTNLIENRKKNIGDNLGDFVVANFLSAASIRPYVQRLQVSALLAQWLAKEKNKTLLANEIVWLLKDILNKADEQAIVQYITGQAGNMLKEVKLGELLASGIEIIIERGDHERALDFIVARMKAYIVQNEALVKNKVSEESHFLIPHFVDDMIAGKIVKGAVKYLTAIETDLENTVRKDIWQQLYQFVNDIKSGARWSSELQDISSNLITPERIQQYAASVWKHVHTRIANDLSAENATIKKYLQKMLQDMVHSLQQDELLRMKIDGWVRWNVYRLLLHNKAKVADLISHTVGSWQGKALSRKLELEVGKDLQYIRINGTLVGGLVGLLIYVLTKFFM